MGAQLTTGYWTRKAAKGVKEAKRRGVTPAGSVEFLLAMTKKGSKQDG